jgi:nitrogen-specific signal transduction histidine kinase
MASPQTPDTSAAGSAETATTPVDAPARRQAKMEALEQIAGGVAHDLNDQLAVILGRTGLLLDEEDPASRLTEPLCQIYTAGERAARLVRQLLLFSRQLVPHRQFLDLNGLITETVPSIRRVLDGTVELALELDPALPLVCGDADMLDQVLVNLATNAHEAMPAGGRLVIRTSATGSAKDGAPPEAADRTGSFVRLDVSDTGCGIVAGQLGRVFEPFFTTKSAGGSAGLGLATVWGIVQQHEGRLTVASAVGAGSTFSVFLPAAPAGTVAEAASPAGTKVKRGRETILVVEDEVSLREITVAVLQSEGYRVLQAGSVPEALETWRWHGGRIGLLLTDLLLEGDATGLDLAARLRTESPDLKVICLTGYAPESSAPRLALPPGCRLLRKPCRPQVLLRTARTMLDSNHP